MRYFGGKARVGKKIAEIVNEVAQGRGVWEPFCGACGVTQHLEGPVTASDIHPELISLWKALQKGWVPPEAVTQEEYSEAKKGIGSDEYRAFVGFGCSFGGKWFGGYARGNQASTRSKTERDYVGAARRSLLKIVKNLPDTTRFLHSDFFQRAPEEEVVYCDPPFGKTTAYPGIPVWDSLKFLERCEELHRRGHTVLVSEYAAPNHWQNLKEIRSKKVKALGHGTSSGESLSYRGDSVIGRNTLPTRETESVYLVSSVQP